MHKVEYEIWYDEGFEHVHQNVRFETSNLRMAAERFAKYFSFVEDKAEQFDDAIGNVTWWDGKDIVMMYTYDSNNGTWS